MTSGAFALQTSVREAEAYLQDQLGHIDWIGELDLSQDDSRNLCRIMRGIGKQGETVSFGRIPPAVLITSMVFTARYAEFTDDETPAFWRKYAQDAWHLEAADPSFQQRGRDAFRNARTTLEKQLGLYFPHRLQLHEQDVVGGVYMHAILPRYLEDDFARWLYRLWRRAEDWSTLVDAPTGDLIAQLRADPSLESVRPRLRHFVKRDETCNTAARLAQKLAQAALLYEEGTAPDEIRERLTHVERGIWDALLEELSRDQESRKRAPGRHPGPRADWAWNLDLGASALRVSNVRLSTEQPPARIMWVPDGELPANESQSVAVNPWQVPDGWLIDPVFIDRVSPHGCIFVLDESDQHIGESLPVPPLPEAEIAFFRPKGDGEYALLTDISRVVDGDWYVSMTEQVEIRAAPDGPPLSAVCPVTPMDAYRAQGHKSAGRYNLRLPVTIVIDGEADDLRPRRTYLNVRLVGDHVVGLTDAGLPVFHYAPLDVRIISATALSADRLRQLRLRLAREGELPTELRLDNAIQVSDTEVMAPLDGQIMDQGGVYSLMLLQGVARVLPEPLRFAVLPSNVRIESPEANGYYTVSTPPVARLLGVQQDQVLIDSGLVSSETDGIRITWSDPLQPCRIQLRCAHALIPLGWDVRWTHAWAEPQYVDKTLTDEDLASATLHLRGAPRQSFDLKVGEGGPRSVQLSAYGRYDTPIRDDQLSEMLRAYLGGRIPVHATDGRSEWALFTLIRRDMAAFEALPALVKRAIRSARELKRVRGRHRPSLDSQTLASLLALPPDELDGLPVEGLSPALKAIRDAHQQPPEGLKAGRPPSAFPVELEIINSSECITVLTARPCRESGNGEGKLLVERPVALPDGVERVREPLSIEVMWQAAEAADQVRVQIHTRDIALRQCSVCHQFFVDDPKTRMWHSHGRGWSAQHPDPGCEDYALVAIFRAKPRDALAAWQPTFSHALDRAAVRTLRIYNRDRAKQEPQDDLYTRQGYRYAVAEWALRLGQAETQKALDKLVSDETKQRTLRAREQLIANRDTTQSLTVSALSYLAEELKPQEDDSWYTLDMLMLLVAMACRAAAYNIPEYGWLSEEMPDQWLNETLTLAQTACPHLLAWAFAWTELYFAALGWAAV
jgi:hypothetical protein